MKLLNKSTQISHIETYGHRTLASQMLLFAKYKARKMCCCVYQKISDTPLTFKISVKHSGLDFKGMVTSELFVSELSLLFRNFIPSLNITMLNCS